MPDSLLPEFINDPLLAARIQFAANITFHILFPAISIALSWILVWFRLRFDRGGGYTHLPDVWFGVVSVSPSDGAGADERAFVEDAVLAIGFPRLDRRIVRKGDARFDAERARLVSGLGKHGRSGGEEQDGGERDEE